MGKKSKLKKRGPFSSSNWKRSQINKLYIICIFRLQSWTYLIVLPVCLSFHPMVFFLNKGKISYSADFFFGLMSFCPSSEYITCNLFMPYCAVARLVILTEWLRSCMADSSLISMIWRWSFASGHLLTHAKKIIIAERNFLNSFLKNINDNRMQSSHANHPRNCSPYI